LAAPGGYADVLETIADPEHERHSEMLEGRQGGSFDPDAFDAALRETTLIELATLWSRVRGRSPV
jgi:hypothetical protein